MTALLNVSKSNCTNKDFSVVRFGYTRRELSLVLLQSIGSSFGQCIGDCRRHRDNLCIIGILICENLPQLGEDTKGYFRPGQNPG